MCGIAGVIYADPNRPVDRNVLKAMGDAIAHRGPDAEGFFREPGLGLVHRRLSIIDLAGGDQPIGNEDGSVQLVFNGEIYNHLELRSSLESRGHRFRTRTDTEVLVHLYEEHGDRLCERLRGMFAFALWDRRAKRLVLARDRLGIKPLYLYRDAEKLIFGSELKAILAHPDVPRELDVRALEDYLTFGMVPGPRSIFRRISKLPPAHVLTTRADELNDTPRRYWQLRFEPDYSLTAEQWQELIRAKVQESIRLHLMADVPVGAFLSGGIDSSVVVGCAAHARGEPLRTFSIVFDDDSQDELLFARQVAERFGTRHAEQVVTPDDAKTLDDLTWYFDEPFADSSAVPTLLVSRLASRTVKVALSGDGGDEAFGGYARYVHDLREAAIRNRLPNWFRRSVVGPVAGAWPKADWLPRPLRAKTALTNLSLDAASAYANTLARCRQPLRRQLLDADVVAELDGHRSEEAVRSTFAATAAGDALAAMIAADVAIVLPDDFLVKVDRASMACGLEVRPPLVDHELFEMAARIPSELKTRAGQGKWIFKQAFRDSLPPAVVSRRKRGFDAPIDNWLRGPLKELFHSTVLDSRGSVSNLIDQTTAGKLYRSHALRVGRHGDVLWSLLVLAHWAERFLSATRHLPPSTTFVPHNSHRGRHDLLRPDARLANAPG